MATVTDVVTAAQAACDAAEAFGLANGWTGTTRVQAISGLTAANQQVATLTTHLATLGTDVDAVLAAAQKAEADK